jgi:hypothetical protein
MTKDKLLLGLKFSPVTKKWWMTVDAFFCYFASSFQNWRPKT